MRWPWQRTQEAKPVKKEASSFDIAMATTKELEWMRLHAKIITDHRVTRTDALEVYIEALREMFPEIESKPLVLDFKSRLKDCEKELTALDLS